MTEIGIGIIGGGYMGKAHAVAMQAVGAVFETALRPRLEMVCATTADSAERYRAAFGFNRATGAWRDLVRDERVEAVVIAAPQTTHRAIAEAAFTLGKPVFCEKPLGATPADAEAMVAAAETTGCVAMTGFNYIRTPASQAARNFIAEGRIGRPHWFRGEHTEDFLADPATPASWRTDDRTTGTMGDLAPHIVNAAHALIGPIAAVMADIATIHPERNGITVGNDDQGQMLCRFESGVMGHLFFSRTATGRKMGYAYEIHGDRGSIRFDQEDQNALWIYQTGGPRDTRGFTKVLTGPEHPDYAPFCRGPGHGTGYQDQIIIEARDFLRAIETGVSVWPDFREGLAVHQVIDAAWRSHESRRWCEVNRRPDVGRVP